MSGGRGAAAQKAMSIIARITPGGAVKRVVPLGGTLGGGAAAVVTADDGVDYAVIVTRQTINGPLHQAEWREDADLPSLRVGVLPR